MEFKQARHNEYPPYLLGFEGTPGERHVENLKVRIVPVVQILGLPSYADPARSWLCCVP